MVVTQELAKHMVEVAAAEDQMMIQQFVAGRANPSFGERIGARSPVRQADHPYPLAFEDFVEGRRQLGSRSWSKILGTAHHLAASKLDSAPAARPTLCPDAGCNLPDVPGDSPPR